MKIVDSVRELRHPWLRVARVAYLVVAVVGWPLWIWAVATDMPLFGIATLLGCIGVGLSINAEGVKIQYKKHFLTILDDMLGTNPASIQGRPRRKFLLYNTYTGVLALLLPFVFAFLNQ